MPPARHFRGVLTIGSRGLRSRARRRAGVALLAVAAVLAAGLVLPTGTPRASAASCGTTNIALNQTGPVKDLDQMFVHHLDSAACRS